MWCRRRSVPSGRTGGGPSDFPWRQSSCGGRRSDYIARSGPSIRERRERVSWFDQIPPPACIAPDRPVTSARSFTSAARQPRRRADRSARDRMPALPQTGMNPRPYALERPMHTLFWLRTDLRAHDNPALPPPRVTARSQRCSSQRPDNGNCMATRRPRSTSGCATCMRCRATCRPWASPEVVDGERLARGAGCHRALLRGPRHRAGPRQRGVGERTPPR